MAKKRIVAYFPGKVAKCPEPIYRACRVYYIPDVNGDDPIEVPDFQGLPDLILVFSGCQFGVVNDLLGYAKRFEIPLLQHLSGWNHTILCSKKMPSTKWFHDQFQDDLVHAIKRSR